MTQPPGGGQEARLAIDLPDEVVAGTYADFASVWHNKDVFVLDFAVLVQPPVPAQDETGTSFMVLPAKVVSRVRIPPAQVFEVMKALEQQLSAWERETAQRPPTDDPGLPPLG